MYIAKMTTKYPDFKGEGYYNFLMTSTSEEMTEKLEENKHDFYLINEIKTRYQSVEAILKKYPTKEELNKGLFS